MKRKLELGKEEDWPIQVGDLFRKKAVERKNSGQEKRESLRRSGRERKKKKVMNIVMTKWLVVQALSIQSL